ncbi:putative oxidoreductase [Dyella jiangningensis]|uniref:DoxX family protein n=1 Tax=Dyella sp. AtDHG13 TaxID=1938897 RepID=UPI0008925885|nr:DoxX family protein [Dyella sp. AtDHG13]PXV59909.1 putative oxidoreductase [Dyella sp. AtDHG13]SDJ18044.1 putative oxidoreductase [Dyella jiangningensis]
MRYTLLAGSKDGLLLLARLLLMVLFVIFGWSKLTAFSDTATYMGSVGVPMPTVTAAIAVIMEFFVGIAIAVGFYTRPLAIVLALYTVAAAVIGHQFWNLVDPERIGAMINFYKNVSIAGGLVLLCVAGPGKYSLDRR